MLFYRRTFSSNMLYVFVYELTHTDLCKKIQLNCVLLLREQYFLRMKFPAKHFIFNSGKCISLGKFLSFHCCTSYSSTPITFRLCLFLYISSLPSSWSILFVYFFLCLIVYTHIFKFHVVYYHAHRDMLVDLIQCDFSNQHQYTS